MNCLFLYVICNHFSQNDSSLNVQLSVIEFVYLCHDCHRNKFANPRNILWSFDEYSFDPPRPGPVTESPLSLFFSLQQATYRHWPAPLRFSAPDPRACLPRSSSIPRNAAGWELEEREGPCAPSPQPSAGKEVDSGWLHWEGPRVKLPLGAL